MNKKLPLVWLWAFLLFVSGNIALSQDKVFSRQVLPILSDRCFHCHGPDESTREADLRLDLEDAAKEDLGGYAPITAGSLEDSEIWQRITSDDPDLHMPPPDSHRKALTEEEQQVIAAWIEAGAPWGRHWSFERIERPNVPNDGRQDTHPVDAFIRSRLQSEELTPASPAAPHTQLRRLYFTLTGLAPTPEQIDTFVSDKSDDAWSSTVDDLLESPRHAERLAMWWLDAARYSDSDGFQQDATRQNWPWRDWVVDSFQDNMPFDQFTIEQFAGDLLPDATDAQILATCFHRNHMTNGEGGRDPEESRVDYVIDRVNTTGTVWLGLTLGCTQCHAHKFDPISQEDYYGISAFFNSIDEDGKAGNSAKPYLKFTSDHVEPQIQAMTDFVAQCREQEKSERKAAEERFSEWIATQDLQEPDGYAPWTVVAPTAMVSSYGTQFELLEEGVVQTSGPDEMHDEYRLEVTVPKSMRRVTGWRIEVLPHADHVGGKFTRYGTGDFTLTSAKVLGRREGSPAEVEQTLSRAVADFEPDKDRKSNWDTRYTSISKTLNDDARDGWTTETAEKIEPHVGVFQLKEPWVTAPGDRLLIVLKHGSTHGHANIGRFRLAITDELGDTLRRTDGGSPMQKWLQLHGQEDRSDAWQKELADARKRLLAQFLLSDQQYQVANLRFQIATKQLKQLKGQANPRSIMVLKEREKPRKTQVLIRGVWDAKGDEVGRGTIPAVLEWPQERLQTRLDLAKWLVDRDNPLTARVIVNQLWQLMFGAGLVRTPEDFGLQGQLPTHPELLDWLAMELIESGWDLRHVLRLIATSETFRQSSVATPELLELDPKNRLLARYSKRRLPAWMLRDNVLHVSGLLNESVGGPPVFPYQPPGVWSEITMGRFSYEPSLGPAQYRRTLYAFWRRSSAPAFLFDSAQRRVCEVGVRQTNTPLQALTLMNSEAVLEASRVLADQMLPYNIVEGPQILAIKILGRKLSDDEVRELQQLQTEAYSYFELDRDAAFQLTSVGQQTPFDPDDSHNLAAWMVVVNLMLNLDEAISYE